MINSSLQMATLHLPDAFSLRQLDIEQEEEQEQSSDNNSATEEEIGSISSPASPPASPPSPPTSSSTSLSISPPTSPISLVALLAMPSSALHLWLSRAQPRSRSLLQPDNSSSRSTPPPLRRTLSFSASDDALISSPASYSSSNIAETLYYEIPELAQDGSSLSPSTYLRPVTYHSPASHAGGRNEQAQPYKATNDNLTNDNFTNDNFTSPPAHHSPPSEAENYNDEDDNSEKQTEKLLAGLALPSSVREVFWKQAIWNRYKYQARVRRQDVRRRAARRVKFWRERRERAARGAQVWEMSRMYKWSPLRQSVVGES